MVNTIIEIIAKNPPSIAVAIAGLLALAGDYNNAIKFLFAGIFLQGLWILGRYVLS
jgi:hypothetical protein